MRGVLLGFIASSLMSGCGCGDVGIEGDADATDSAHDDVGHESTDSLEDPLVDIELDDGSAPCHECEAGYRMADTWVDCTGNEGRTTSGGSPPVAVHFFDVGRPWLEDGDDTVRITIECIVVPVVIAVLSCEPATWLIESYPGADIEQIIVSGHIDQHITGVSDVPVTRGVDCCYDDWYESDPPDTECFGRLQELAESFGAEYMSVDTCEYANSFCLTHQCRE